MKAAKEEQHITCKGTRFLNQKPWKLDDSRKTSLNCWKKTVNSFTSTSIPRENIQE